MSLLPGIIKAQFHNLTKTDNISMFSSYSGFMGAEVRGIKPKTLRGDRTPSKMEDVFRLKEGMFRTVRHNWRDQRVLRLKEMVMGYVINSYQPTPYHFHRERHAIEQSSRDLKFPVPVNDSSIEGKTLKNGMSKSSGKSKVQQMWLAEHINITPGIQQKKPEQKRKSQEIKHSEKSENKRVSTVNAGSKTRVNNDPSFAPKEEAASAEHKCVHGNGKNGNSVVNNGSIQRSSSSSSAHQFSSSNVLRDSWDRFLNRIRSEPSTRKKPPMRGRERLSITSGDQATSSQSRAAIAVSNRHSKITQSPKIQTSVAPIFRSLNPSVNDRVETTPEHQNIASYMETDSPGSRSPTAQHSSGTSLIDHSTSKRLHEENNTSIPKMHRKVSISDGSAENRQASVSIAQKYLTPEVKTSTAGRNIVIYLSADSSCSKRSPDTSVTPPVDRHASKRSHEENNSSIPAKQRKVPTPNGSKRNRHA